MKISLTRAARTDILHQYEYYLEQASTNIAARFIVAEAAKSKHLASLRSWPIKKFEDGAHMGQHA